MSGNLSEQYVEQYAEYAMEQMSLYGIPASIILAQGILESANGQSTLAQKENNHFGMKASQSWLNNGGSYGVYNDDKPNEKFCHYDSVRDSYTHHSQVLRNSDRYASCFSLAADDYRGWAAGLQRAGYATDSTYAAKLTATIDRYNLQQYDQQVIQTLAAQGRAPGYATARDPHYSFPVERDEYLFITSPFGMRTDPMDGSKQQMHKGIDIRCHNDAVLATEMGGKVISVNHNANTSGGKSVTVEYEREGGEKMRCTYMHLSNIDVKIGDTVNAGDKLGVSGNTGTRTTGEHLHFGVQYVTAEGVARDIDPAIYLAEIGQRGNIALQALSNGTDLLAQYRSEFPSPAQEAGIDLLSGADNDELSPEDWLTKLLSSDDSALGYDSSGDPLVDLIMKLFSMFMMLVMLKNADADDEEKKASISTMVSEGKVDLTSLVNGMKSCTLSIVDGKAVLDADNGVSQVSRELSEVDLQRLNTILSDSNMSDETKVLRVSGIVNNIVLSEQASQNFEQALNEQQGQTETMRR